MDDLKYYLMIYAMSYFINIFCFIARYFIDSIATDKKIEAHVFISHYKRLGINGLSSAETDYFTIFMSAFVPIYQIVACLFDYSKLIYEVKKKDDGKK